MSVDIYNHVIEVLSDEWNTIKVDNPYGKQIISVDDDIMVMIKETYKRNGGKKESDAEDMLVLKTISELYKEHKDVLYVYLIVGDTFVVHPKVSNPFHILTYKSSDEWEKRLTIDLNDRWTKYINFKIKPMHNDISKWRDELLKTSEMASNLHKSVKDIISSYHNIIEMLDKLLETSIRRSKIQQMINRRAILCEKLKQAEKFQTYVHDIRVAIDTAMNNPYFYILNTSLSSDKCALLTVQLKSATKKLVDCRSGIDECMIILRDRQDNANKWPIPQRLYMLSLDVIDTFWS